MYDKQKPEYEYIDVSSCDQSKIRNIQGKDYGIIAVVYRNDEQFDLRQMNNCEIQTKHTTTIINDLEPEGKPTARLRNIPVNNTEQKCINTETNSNYKFNEKLDDKFVQNTKRRSITVKPDENEDINKKRMNIVRIRRTNRVMALNQDGIPSDILK